MVDGPDGRVFLVVDRLARPSGRLEDCNLSFAKVSTGSIESDMKRTFILIALAGAALLCGCGKQTKINSAEIKILSQQMIQIQQNQARQIAAIQSQLASLAPMLDKINNYYFEKSRDDALFYHTNTLYLMLAVNSRIETELQKAAADRKTDSALAFSYHTNSMNLLNFYSAQIQEAMIDQEIRIEARVNAQTKQAGADTRDELLKQIKLSAPDEAEIARQRAMEADVAQIKRELDQIKAQLGQMTNAPAIRP